jgi:Fic family protein
VPKISHINPTLTNEALTLADEAAIEIAKFDSTVGNTVAPFSAILLRSEAASSSQIENLSASPLAIIRAEIGAGETPNASLILSNQTAMQQAISASEDFASESILAMHRALMQRADPENAGSFRTVPVWIGGSPLGPHQADYVGPPADLVPDLIGDLVQFTRRRDLPAMVQIAIAHAQFETIHPFNDGNGRTGRAVIQVLLKHLNISNSLMAPVSAGLLSDTQRYFRALDAYRAGDPNEIVKVLSEAALRAVENGRLLTADLEQIRMDWQQLAVGRAGSAARELLDLLLAQPLITTTRAIELLGRTAVNTQRAIDTLVDAGVLTQIGQTRRNRIWQAREVLFALEQFATRTRRRR